MNMTEKKLLLKNELTTTINKLSLENLCGLNDFVIADFMVESFCGLINSLESREILKGEQPKADINAFLKG